MFVKIDILGGACKVASQAHVAFEPWEVAFSFCRSLGVIVYLQVGINFKPNPRRDFRFCGGERDVVQS